MGDQAGGRDAETPGSAGERLQALLKETVKALEEEMAWLVDVEVDDRGRSKPSLPEKDRDYYEALEDAAQVLQDVRAWAKRREGEKG